MTRSFSRRQLLGLAALAVNAVTGCKRASGTSSVGATPSTDVFVPPVDAPVDASRMVVRDSAVLRPDAGVLRTTTAEVIVIGAGVAGLSAASALRANGTRVIVLEARDRVGGRVWTSRKWPDLPIDLGASWIHGVKNNPLVPLAQLANARTISTDNDLDAMHDSVGRRLSDARNQEVRAGFVRLMKKLDELRETLDDDISLRQGLDKVMRHMQLDSDQQAALEMMINTEIEQEYAADVENLSLLHWDDGDDEPGGDRFFLAGYDVIPQYLARRVDVRLGHIVSKVQRVGRKAIIETNRGSFQCEKVVVCVPLGVLKHGDISFEPELTEDKLRAMESLDMGLLTKTVLRFPTKFWPDTEAVVDFISPQRGQWTEMVNMHTYVSKPVLMMFNGGTYGLAVEAMSEADRRTAALSALRTMFGNAVTEPTDMLVSNWSNDPFARGSYSYIRVGGDGDDRDILAQPMDGWLFFAGEATSRDHAATVHGALVSGQRAAKQVLA